MFHVSSLKKVIGTNNGAQTVLPKLDNEGSIIFKLETIFNKGIHQLLSQSIIETLIQWHKIQPDDGTCEPLLHI